MTSFEYLEWNLPPQALLIKLPLACNFREVPAYHGQAHHVEFFHGAVGFDEVNIGSRGRIFFTKYGFLPAGNKIIQIVVKYQF
jgi:hypothetical protein